MKDQQVNGMELKSNKKKERVNSFFGKIRFCHKCTLKYTLRARFIKLIVTINWKVLLIKYYNSLVGYIFLVTLFRCGLRVEIIGTDPSRNLYNLMVRICPPKSLSKYYMGFTNKVGKSQNVLKVFISSNVSV